MAGLSFCLFTPPSYCCIVFFWKIKMQVQDPLDFVRKGRRLLPGRRRDLDKIHNKWQDERTFKLTLLETNTAPENGWFEYYFPFGKTYFQVLAATLVSGSVNPFISRRPYRWTAQPRFQCSSGARFGFEAWESSVERYQPFNELVVDVAGSCWLS